MAIAMNMYTYHTIPITMHMTIRLGCGSGLGMSHRESFTVPVMINSSGLFWGVGSRFVIRGGMTAHMGACITGI